MASSEVERNGAATLPSATIDLLRQLATGLGVHRLYDGGDAVAAAEAAARIATAARVALDVGGCDVGIAGGRFAGGPASEHLDRLAGALFERRVEHLRFEAVPAAAELRALFAALIEDPEVVAQADGVQALLDAAGVTSLWVSEDAPDPTSGREVAEELWTRAAEPADDDGVAELTLALELLPEQDADALYDKLRSIAARLPEDRAARSSFYREVAVLSAALPATERARFDRLLLDAAASELFAERALGHLTDVDLADLVARVARHEGLDPRPLARQVAGLGHRHANLPRLVLERGLARNRAEDPGSTGDDRDPVAMEYGQDVAAAYDQLMAADPASPGVGPAASLPPAPAVGAAATSQPHPLALDFPDDEAAGRAIAATTLVDLLLQQPRAEHLDGVCAAMEAQLRADIAAARVTEVRLLLDAWHRAVGLVDAMTARQLEEVLPRVLDVEVVVAALEEGPAPALALLQPFGASAVAPLIAALEPYRPAAVRHAAREVLAEVVADHLDAVGAAIGPRSADARKEVLSALRQVRSPGVAGALGRVAQHRDTDLQLRVVDALAALDTARSAPVLAGIVARAGDREVQGRVLEVLVTSGAPASRDLLRRLGDRSTSPLPGPLRRRARKLAGG